MSRLAIIKGSAAFLAPLMEIVPFRRSPPMMRMRSMASPPSPEAAKARSSMMRLSLIPTSSYPKSLKTFQVHALEAKAGFSPRKALPGMFQGYSPSRQASGIFRLSRGGLAASLALRLPLAEIGAKLLGLAVAAGFGRFFGFASSCFAHGRAYTAARQLKWRPALAWPCRYGRVRALCVGHLTSAGPNAGTFAAVAQW